jgi:hypothetical protein
MGFADDLTASRLRVEDLAAIDGRHDSSDAYRAKVWIDVNLDEVRGICTRVRTHSAEHSSLKVCGPTGNF